MFETNKTYTKRDIYEILSVPVEKQKGVWDTGYREYEGDIYIFANVGIPVNYKSPAAHIPIR